MSKGGVYGAKRAAFDNAVLAEHLDDRTTERKGGVVHRTFWVVARSDCRRGRRPAMMIEARAWPVIPKCPRPECIL